MLASALSHLNPLPSEKKKTTDYNYIFLNIITEIVTGILIIPDQWETLLTMFFKSPYTLKTFPIAAAFKILPCNICKHIKANVSLHELHAHCNEYNSTCDNL